MAALLSLLVACEPRDASRLSAPAPSPAAQDEALGLGDSRVGVEAGSVTIECQSVARGLLLEKLARAARFELVGEVDARPMTLDLKASSLESAIAVLLEDLPYRAQWKFDSRTDRHALARLEVGETALADSNASAASPAEKSKRRDLADALRQQARERREQRELRERAGPSEGQKAEQAARREERARSQADLLEQLRSSNPEMRVEAVEGLDPDGTALAALLEILKNDPDARVREKAAEQGGEADGFVVCAGLLGALGDREPAVVVQALASLEFACDDSVLPIVRESCALNPNAAVQARCAEAIDFLQ